MEDKDTKATNYYKGPEETKDGMTLLNERLSADLRNNVRKLGFYPVLTPAWKEMVTSLSRMAVVTEVESSMPQAKDASLWETEEQAVRFVMEDGKLNLLLRSIVEYKKHRIAVRNTPDELEVLDDIALCDEFENMIGRVLHSCWLHVETLQTTDISALMDHIAAVLKNILDDPEAMTALTSCGQISYRQETMVCLYLGLVLRHVEVMREERIMPYLRKAGVFTSMIRYIHLVHAMLPPSTIVTILQTLSVLVETEDFTTYKESYCNVDDVALLVEFKVSVLTPLLNSMPREQRTSVKPLADAIDKLKRLLGTRK